ncbi:hypothetical protein GYA49_05270 [Candidatus Beckwithbacteria bacterium]|nr:hypothetical protein [Candidatus Beckwithbacteria bacterium]
MKIPWKFILTHVLVLRALTLVAAIVGLYALPFKPSFPYADVALEPYGSSLFWSWANFDGVHYLRLAQDGYIYGLTQAFFPLYMLLIRLFSYILVNKLFVALLISHICFVLALGMFYKLLRLDYSKKIAKWSLVFLIYFPTSFYFLSAYTESLFLLLLLSSFYFLRTKDYAKMGIGGIAVTLTRITGIFIVPAFFYELWEKVKSKSLSQKLILVWTLVPSLGLLAYMYFLQSKFGDALLFAHVQEGFGAGRETDKFVLLYQVLWRYIRMIFTVEKHSWLYFTIWLEFLSSLSFIGLLIWGYIKKIRLSYLIFASLSLLLPTLTGTFSSMPRYVLMLFPGFIVLGMVKNKAIKYGLLGLFAVLLLLCTALFTRGYWVA